MKVKVNLNKLEVIDKDIELISEQAEGETTRQGLPIYQVKSITGEIYFDKGEFTNLCLEATQKAYNELIFDVELVFFAKIKTVCNNGLGWAVDVVGEPKVWSEDEDIIYFDKFEVIQVGITNKQIEEYLKKEKDFIYKTAVNSLFKEMKKYQSILRYLKTRDTYREIVLEYFEDDIKELRGKIEKIIKMSNKSKED